MNMLAGLDLLLCCIAHTCDGDIKSQGLSCQGMVAVQCNYIVPDTGHYHDEGTAFSADTIPGTYKPGKSNG